uniref:Gamma-glutamyltransferase n=1 Tax=Strigamia maritima TaxID=126957 RepID=T1J7U9_STRMM
MALSELKLTRKKCIMIAAVLAVALIVIVTTSVLLSGSKSDVQPIVPGEPEPPPSKRGVFKNAAVVSDAVPCAEAGREILAENGSAVDAAIATLLCMGVYNSQSMGLGGGFFMTIYNKSSGTFEAVDAREVAPAAAKLSLYLEKNSSAFQGPLAVAVPGEIKGYEEAHKRHGVLSWKRLFDFAIRLATDGFPASLHLERSLKHRRSQVLKDKGLRSVYVDNITNDIIKKGDLVKLPRLAETLRAIAEKGADEMYSGEIAKKFVNDIKEFGGIITMEDMRDYQVFVRNTSRMELSGGLTVHSFPAPGSGPIFNLILKVLNGYKWNSESSNELLTYQKFIETFKYAYAFKSRLGDPAFSDLTELINNLTKPETADWIRSQISLDKTFPPSHYGLDNVRQDDYGTAHMSVVSPQGDAVSVTSTVNFWFGAGLMSPSTGIILNNEMDDFTFPKESKIVEEMPMLANKLEPKKRPLSSMCPTIIINGTGHPVLVIGAAGGSRIITGTAMVVARILWWDTDIKDAIDAPRLHHQLIPNHVEYENGIPKTVLQGLVKIGHQLKLRGAYGSVVVGIHRNSKDELISNYDFRKGGSVAGF